MNARLLRELPAILHTVRTELMQEYVDWEVKVRECQNPLKELCTEVRTRATCHYHLDIKVSKVGKSLKLSIKNPHTGQMVSEFFPQDVEDLREMYADWQAFREHADRVIERFMFPVRAL